MKTEATMVVSAKSGKSSAMRSRMSAAVLFCRHVDEHGRISRPIDFRSAFVHLGSRAMLDEAAAARGVHDVYTEGESAEHPRRTGVFPDGATRVKELRGVASGGLSTDSPVMQGGAPAVWFVMIRNGAGRFAGNPLWADGWGWAMFIADDPARNVATSGDADCKACPIPAAASERVFVQGYPTLGKR